MSHATRESVDPQHPLLVTLRLKEGLPGLRQREEYGVLLKAMKAAADRFGLQLVHFAVLDNHLHLVARGMDRVAVSRGFQGLGVRIAKGLNKLWGRRGGVFDDRYHDRELTSPRQVRNAIRYVLLNRAKHAGCAMTFGAPNRPDPFTSASWFQEGFEEELEHHPWLPRRSLLPRPPCWLLTVGWKRHGLLSLREVPGQPR